LVPPEFFSPSPPSGYAGLATALSVVMSKFTKKILFFFQPLELVVQFSKLCTDMQGFLLILQSCNNVIIEHWVKSFAELLNVLKKKKAFYQNNAE